MRPPGGTASPPPWRRRPRGCRRRKSWSRTRGWPLVFLKKDTYFFLFLRGSVNLYVFHLLREVCPLTAPRIRPQPCHEGPWRYEIHFTLFLLKKRFLKRGANKNFLTLSLRVSAGPWSRSWPAGRRPRRGRGRWRRPSQCRGRKKKRSPRGAGGSPGDWNVFE